MSSHPNGNLSQVESSYPMQKLFASLMISVFAGSLLGLFRVEYIFSADLPEQVKFNKHIRPILSDKCLHCHGPDSASREAELRLDDHPSLIKPRSTHPVIKPGSAKDSLLYQRLSSTDEAERMPPAESGKSLTAYEISLIKRWINEGAHFEKHWAFLAPQQSPLPSIPQHQQRWVQNPIDTFVLHSLNQAGLKPSPAANKQTLLRRVSFDLTGLPPSLNELNMFLEDGSPLAYEKAINRLLRSPRYGEHRTRYWLDAARYADTSGFFTDPEREMWHWRDWVIDAFNNNMPFDQFTVEQLAGDLLPEATLSQKIATGFNRNHMTTRETGVIDEEYRVEYVVDRLETTSTVWLGLTVGCARCHDHKFDPISQTEFYSLFAFFNNIPETGNVRVAGNSPPLLKVPAKGYAEQLANQTRITRSAKAQFDSLQNEIQATRKNWLNDVSTTSLKNPSKGLVAQFSFETNTIDSITPQNLSQIRGQINYVPGLVKKAAQFNGKSLIEIPESFQFHEQKPFTISAWIKPGSSGPCCIISKNDDLNQLRGVDLLIRKGKLVAHLVHQWNKNAIEVSTVKSIATNQWQHVVFSYDGSRSAAGVKLYIDAVLQPVSARYDSLSGTIDTAQPLRIGRRSTSALYRGIIDELLCYNRELNQKEINRLYAAQLITGTLEQSAKKHSTGLQKKLNEYFLNKIASSQIKQAHHTWKSEDQKLALLQKKSPTAMIMSENKKPRKTYLLIRGQYDQPGKEVSAAVPASLPGLKNQGHVNRLDFARWLVNNNNPLTARVTVNRIWRQIFGIGLVKTVEDFGSQGEWPSHPELLDWLAVEFMNKGWNVKHIIKLIVTSATYQQTSRAAATLYQRDPENRLLARGPRFRLDAEIVRDNALAVSGLLTHRLGGPSVKPYQPTGLWKAVSYDGGLIYKQDSGEALYRRSLYTYWKRQSPPPSMMAFDAPTRETCTVSRPRTNTPLQALVLMNDPTFLEASRVLAERLLKISAGKTSHKIRELFQIVLCRQPDPTEVNLLSQLYQQQLLKYQTESVAAKKLVQVGDHPVNRQLDISQLAAWTIISSIVLNLDETITKN